MSIDDFFGSTCELLRLSQKVGLDVLKKGDRPVVGIYFSAHWCPPCRAFTPKLAEWYNNFKETSPNKDSLEIVFVSSDREQKSFDEYYSEMPWLALPYEQRDLKTKMSQQFKVSGIPTLIFLDGNTGKVITKDGRSIVSDDPAGNDFPWTPKGFLDVVPGPLLNKDKDAEWGDVKEDVIGLYFSAHWCGPCRAFTPQLVDTYNTIRADGKSFQLIFVSSDRDEESFKEYYGTMPWLSLPFGDKRKTTLSRLFDVSGIPTLVIMKRSGEVITSNGRAAISSDNDGKDFPWTPRAVNPLNGTFAAEINDCPAIIHFTKNEDKEVVKTCLETVAVAHIESKPENRVHFFYHAEDEDEEDIGTSLRGFAHIPDGENLVLINIPEQKVYSVAAGDENTAKTVLDKFLSGKLAMKELRMTQ